MADDYVQLPADGTGKKLDTDSLTVGANSVHRERHRLAGATANALTDVVDTDPTSTHFGVVIRPIEVEAPVSDYRTSADLAPDASVNLDGSTIAAGKIGKLMRVEVACSVACRWELQTRDGALVTTLGVMMTSGLAGLPSRAWVPPDKRFHTLAGNGVDENFRVVAKNLGDRAATVYATIDWDEV